MINEVADNVGQLFDDQIIELKMLRNCIDFTMDYTPNKNDDEIFIISNYNFPSHIENVIKNSISVPVIDIAKVVDGKTVIKGVLCIVSVGSSKSIAFQYFTRKNTLGNKFSIFHDKNTFKTLNDPGIIFDSKLAAYYENGNLKFHSYHITSRFLPIHDYFTAATDDEIDEFSRLEIIELEDIFAFKAEANDTLRKKIAILLKSNVLSGVRKKDIEEARDALNAGVPPPSQLDLQFNNNKLLIPKDKRLMTMIIKLLNEDYFKTPLTQQTFQTNSKRSGM